VGLIAVFQCMLAEDFPAFNRELRFAKPPLSPVRPLSFIRDEEDAESRRYNWFKKAAVVNGKASERRSFEERLENVTLDAPKQGELISALHDDSVFASLRSTSVNTERTSEESHESNWAWKSEDQEEGGFRSLMNQFRRKKDSSGSNRGFSGAKLFSFSPQRDKKSLEIPRMEMA
jgi:hypothetical protein